MKFTTEHIEYFVKSVHKILKSNLVEFDNEEDKLNFVIDVTKSVHKLLKSNLIEFDNEEDISNFVIDVYKAIKKEICGTLDIKI